MLIQPSNISPEALHSIALDYLTSGADQYLGDIENELPKVIDLVKKGELLISFSLVDETTVLRPKEEFNLPSSYQTANF